MALSFIRAYLLPSKRAARAPGDPHGAAFILFKGASDQPPTRVKDFFLQEDRPLTLTKGIFPALASLPVL
jgi:hypothetical protein